MTKTVFAWAIHHPAQGILLHSVHANQPGTWAMLHLHSRPEEQRPKSDAEVLGFRAIQIKVKYDIEEARA